MKTLASAIAVAISISPLTVACGHNGAARPGKAGGTNVSGAPTASAAGDRFVPAITVDGQPLTFPEGTATIWPAGTPPSNSCDQHVERPGVDFNWAGAVDSSQPVPQIRSLVTVTIGPDPSNNVTDNNALDDIDIKLDTTKAPNPDSSGLGGGPANEHYWARLDGDPRYSGLRNSQVSKTPEGYAIQTEARWVNGAGGVEVEDAWHAVSLTLVCHP